MTKSERWILSEWLVAKDRRDRFQERLLKHRERTPFAEIDLLTQARTGDLNLIEVKSWQGDLWSSLVISNRQLQRLLRARAYLEARSGLLVRLQIAVVSHDSSNLIRYFDPPSLY